jgi:hypothetical protein
MSTFGKILLHAGLALRLNFASTNTMTLDIGGDPTTSWTSLWPANPPGATSLLTMAPDGTMGYQSIGGGGSVTSVGLALPSIFTVSGSPVTVSGTLSATLASQSANAVFAAPDGSAGTPTFRALVANDIPSLLAAKISNFDTQVRLSRLDQMAAPTANVALNGQKITGLAEPTQAQDAATKNYVDTAIVGAVIFKGTADGSAANPAAATGSAVWSNGWQYRISVAGNTAFGYQVNVGDFVIYNGTTWNHIDATDPAVTGTTNRITVTPTGDTSYAVDIATNYAGQNTITTVGTIATGVWNGTEIAVANGGTGATTAAAARTNLGAAGVAKGSFDNATLVSGVLTVTHNLGNQWPDVVVYDNNNKRVFPDDVTGSSTTAAAVDLSTFGTITGTWHWTAVG